MKKLLLFHFIGTILIITLAACSSYEGLPLSAKTSNDIITIKAETAEIDNKDFHEPSSISGTDIQDWQRAYIQFLQEFIILEDFEICEYALKDINLDGVPELILLQSDQSVKALLEIYSFKNKVFKTGGFTNIKVGSALCVSDHPLYPGLFLLRWGGGVEHYEYITVEEDLLVYEYLWFNNLAPEEAAIKNGKSGKNMVSDNKELIELSENVFQDVNDDNILEMFILGEDDEFQPIINYISK